ncbi:hypothetical protein EBN88_18680, partial [Streptomyces triticirhizae]
MRLLGLPRGRLPAGLAGLRRVSVTAALLAGNGLAGLAAGGRETVAALLTRLTGLTAGRGKAVAALLTLLAAGGRETVAALLTRLTGLARLARLTGLGREDLVRLGHALGRAGLAGGGLTAARRRETVALLRGLLRLRRLLPGRARTGRRGGRVGRRPVGGAG